MLEKIIGFQVRWECCFSIWVLSVTTYRNCIFSPLMDDWL